MPMVEIDDAELKTLRTNAAGFVKQTAIAEALRGELTTAQASAARVPALEAEVGTFKAAQLDSTFAAAGVTDAKVRKVFQLEFDEQAAVDGGEKDIGKWLTGLQGMEADKRPAHLAPFIKAPATGSDAGGGAGGAGTGTRAPLPNADKGTKVVQGAPPAFTGEQIGAMDDATFVQNFEKLQATIPGMQGFQLPNGFKPATA